MGVCIDPERLRYWRDMRLMSRTQLAEAARLSYDSVVSYELGRKSPRQSAFRRLFTALGIGPEDLLRAPGNTEPGQEVRASKKTRKPVKED